MEDPTRGLYAKDKYGRPIKDPAKAAKKLKYSELVALQNGQDPAAANQAAPGTPNAATPGTPAANSIAGKPFTADLRGYGDTVNTALYGNTTLVSDHSKVYKGGSWNDRAMWLNPATRRYMDQGEASAEVGFRCAMSMVGTSEINPNGKSHFSVKKPKPYNPKK
jgi:hypothetical protein